MKRLGMLIAAGVLVLGSAPPALAQFSLGDTPGGRTPAYTVSFNGQLRVIGVAWDNLNDFTDTDKGAKDAAGKPIPCGTGATCKDSNSRYFERLRWWLTIESADKKAKIVWNAQVGDLTWGNGNGVADELGSTNPAGGSSSRVGTNAGGAAGARGVNMQQRQIYIAFEPWIADTRATLGIQYLQFLDGPAAEFFADNEPGIRFDWLGKPVDVSVWTAKLSENDLSNADDNDFYAARIGVNLGPDMRITVEGLVGNWQCFQRRPLAAGATAANTTLTNKGTCVKADFADPFWVGGTFNGKVAGITLFGLAVYGERPIYSNALNKVFKERGYGLMANAQVPIGPLGVTGHGWYTSGDKDRFVGGAGGGACGTRVNPNPAGDCHGVGNTTKINRNSNKLPVPESGSSWVSVPYIADFLTGNATVGGPTGLGQPLNADVTGTWGVGAAVSWALTPAFNLNFGAAFVGASETKNSNGGKNAIFGDNAIELDAGPRWTINPNLSMQAVGAYIIPDKGDSAWGAIYRFVYFF